MVQGMLLELGTSLHLLKRFSASHIRALQHHFNDFEIKHFVPVSIIFKRWPQKLEKYIIFKHFAKSKKLTFVKSYPAYNIVAN
jgi:hypothetical protein